MHQEENEKGLVNSRWHTSSYRNPKLPAPACNNEKTRWINLHQLLQQYEFVFCSILTDSAE